VIFRIFAFLLRHPSLLRVIDPWMGEYNPIRPGHHEDPYPQYHQIRSEAPVYFHPRMKIWFLSRYDDVVTLLRDPRFIANRMRSNAFQRRNPFEALPPGLQEGIRKSLLMTDAPDHTRMRNLVNRAFTPRMVDGLRPRIESLVEEQLDRVAPTGEMELVQDLAYPLPVTVIAELLGVPGEDRARFKGWSTRLRVLIDPIQAIGKLDAAVAAYDEMSEYFRGLFAERRRAPRDDLLSALVAAEDDGDRLDEIELLALSALILGAGHETTTNLIGNSVLALLRNPGERKRLQDDPGLVESAVEEFLRYDSPVQATDRVASEDCEIDGHAIRQGEFVVTLLGAANRDPARFPQPDRLDLARDDGPPVSFGQGPHFCLGAHLARLEAQIAIASLLRRFPDLDGPSQPAGWVPSMVLRGPSELPLSLR
jgi:cytochrome P450